jgi:hypothetical protein
VTSYPDEPRPAVIQLPSSVPGGGKRSADCLFLGIEGKRLVIDAYEPVAVSTVISVEYEDTMFLGEVITCNRNQDFFHLEIKVEQVLNGLQSLMALRAQLLNEWSNQPQSAPVRTASYN